MPFNLKCKCYNDLIQRRLDMRHIASLRGCSDLNILQPGLFLAAIALVIGPIFL